MNIQSTCSIICWIASTTNMMPISNWDQISGFIGTVEHELIAIGWSFKIQVDAIVEPFIKHRQSYNFVDSIIECISHNLNNVW